MTSTIYVQHLETFSLWIIECRVYIESSTNNLRFVLNEGWSLIYCKLTMKDNQKYNIVCKKSDQVLRWVFWTAFIHVVPIFLINTYSKSSHLLFHLFFSSDTRFSCSVFLSNAANKSDSRLSSWSNLSSSEPSSAILP